MARGRHASGTGKATAARYLKYIATILPTYYFKSPTHGRHVRVPQVYAILVGMNLLLTAEDFEVAGDHIVGPTWPTHAAFQQLLNHEQIWNRGDAFLNAPLKELRNFGYLSKGRPIEVTTAGLLLLVEHARLVHKYFTHKELAPSTAPYPAWLELNTKIFGSFFLGAFGDELIKVRDAVNKAVAVSKQTASTVDPLSAQTTRWMLLNLVGLFHECTSNEFSRLVGAYGLEPLAPGAREIARAEREFVKAGVFEVVGERPFRKYRLTADYRTLVDAMIAQIDPGLDAIEAACLEFGDGLVKGQT